MEKQPLRPNEQRTRLVIISSWIFFGFTILSIITNYFYYQLFVSSGFPPDVIETIFNLQVSVALLVLVVDIICIVLFILWFRRAYANLHRHGITWLAYHNSWAALAWFVPLLNFFRPFQIMREIWIETQEAYLGRGKATNDLIVIFWWIFVILSNLLENIGVQMQEGDFINSILRGTIILLIGNVLSLVAIVVTIMMVKKTNQFEQKLYQTNHEVDISEHLIGESIE